MNKKCNVSPIHPTSLRRYREKRDGFAANNLCVMNNLKRKKGLLFVIITQFKLVIIDIRSRISIPRHCISDGRRPHAISFKKVHLIVLGNSLLPKSYLEF